MGLINRTIFPVPQNTSIETFAQEISQNHHNRPVVVSDRGVLVGRDAYLTVKLESTPGNIELKHGLTSHIVDPNSQGKPLDEISYLDINRLNKQNEANKILENPKGIYDSDIQVYGDEIDPGKFAMALGINPINKKALDVEFAIRTKIANSFRAVSNFFSPS